VLWVRVSVSVCGDVLGKWWAGRAAL